MSDVVIALAACLAQRREAALPLVFTQEAEDEANQQSLAQFHQNLAAVGGWAAARDSLLRASKLYGELAKSFALFQKPHATEILPRHAERAREIVEEQCQMRVAIAKGKTPATVTVADGSIC